MFSTSVNFTQLELGLFTTVVPPLLYFIARFAVNSIVGVIQPYVGQAQALVVQQRADELLDKAIGTGVTKCLPWIQTHSLTVDVQNLITREVARYAVDHASDLATQIGGLEEKALAQLITHPALQAALALPAPAAQPAAAHAA